MSIPIIIIGAGGHGRVLAEALLAGSRVVIGFLDQSPDLQRTVINGTPVLGNDDMLQEYSRESIGLVNGIGSTWSTVSRRLVYERLTAIGYRFETVCHPSATIAPSAQILNGSQIMAGAVLQTGCLIGENTIVNSGAIVDHDCIIGNHCHIAPGVVLSGSVKLGDSCHVGTGATVIQGVKIGEGSLVAAGAVVIQDVPPDVRVAGVPARVMEKA